jgi:hypothetical protein
MAKSILDNRKKRGRGRPATGITPMTGVRLSSDTLKAIKIWTEQEPDKPSKAEAIRRLVEYALRVPAAHRHPPRAESVSIGRTEESSRAKAVSKATAMAGKQIDKLSDTSATVEERQSRKRRLLKGPKEFRDIREQALADGPKRRK